MAEPSTSTQQTTERPRIETTHTEMQSPMSPTPQGNSSSQDNHLSIQTSTAVGDHPARPPQAWRPQSLRYNEQSRHPSDDKFTSWHDGDEHDRDPRHSAYAQPHPDPMQHSPAGIPHTEQVNSRQSKKTTLWQRLFERKDSELIPPHFDEGDIPEKGAVNVAHRLKHTRQVAERQIEELDAKAKQISLRLNTAIGLQVIIGAIITGLSAISSGRTTQIATAVFGALATIIASFLAKARGSEEPETSKIKVKELQEFLRDMNSFVLDHALETGDQHAETIQHYRERLEEIVSSQRNKPRGLIQRQKPIGDPEKGNVRR